MENVLEKLVLSIDLLEIATTYCEANLDNALGFSALESLLNIVIKEQEIIFDALEEIA